MGRFVHELRVTWSDVDLAGIVYFPRFLSYFEMTELEWVRHQGYGYHEFLRKMNVWMPRVAAHCNYRAPARLDDILAIEMRLVRLGRTSFTLGYRAILLPQKTTVADGYTVIATVSRSRFRAVRIPAVLRRRLESLRARPRSSVKRRRRGAPGGG